jgi:DNA-binding CsgD family transcriptional regulator
MAAEDRDPQLHSVKPADGADENPLSSREMEVSQLLVTGASNTEIARALNISPQTVKVHLRNVFEKLQVSSRTEASMVLLQRGWLTVPGVALPVAPVESPPLPEPAPLEDLPAQPEPWQLGMMVFGLALALVLLFLPGWLSRPKSSVGLLSDGGQTVVGKPVVDALPRWEARTPLPQARSRLSAVQTGGMIYVIGGEGGDGRALDVVDIYDLRFNRWLSGPALPEPLANVATTVTDQFVVVGGGSSGTSSSEVVVSDDLYLLDLTDMAWRPGGLLPRPLAGAVMLAHGDALYLVGGWDGATMRGEVWRLGLADLEDAAPDDWTEVTRLPTPAAFLGATMAGDEIVVAGGYDGQRELADAAAYDVVEGAWRRLASLSTPRSGMVLIFDGVAVVAFGGGWTRTVATHERYDAVTNQWNNFPSPIAGEWRHLAAALDEGTIHLLGGWSGDYLDTHLQFQSTFRALLPAIPKGDD